ncbi:hypothetical protein AAE121_004669 [Salmonella enterica]
MKREDAFKKFNILKEQYNISKDVLSDANEATIRLIIIDSVLDILGWNKIDFNPEMYCSSAGYSDYLLSIDGKPKLIVEAKKAGVTFGHKYKKINSKEYTISYFKSAFKKNLFDVIEQAQKYCIEKGVQNAVITNGSEWLVAPMLPKPGKTIDLMKGIYFGSIFDDDFSFDYFWSLISKDSVEKNELDNYLSEVNHSQSEICHILRGHLGNLKWRRVSSEPYFDDFYEYFFSQITETNQRKMLEHCFVSDSKLEQFKGELKRVLRDTAPHYLPNDTLDFEPLEGKDFLLNHSDGKVVIITGSVGCGKTTLVTKCLVEARQAKDIYATPILIDLINDVSKNTLNAKEIVLTYLFEQIKTNYNDEFDIENLRKTFSDELKILKNGPFKDKFLQDPDSFIDKEAVLLDKLSSDIQSFVLRVFRKRVRENKSVIIIIDNVDRASEIFQEEIYALSHMISKDSGATVIITLREFTFFRNKENGFLDVRPEDKVIHLKAPDFNKLISSRLRYIKDFSDSDYRVKDWRKKYDYQEFFDYIQYYADSLKKYFQLSSEGNTILEILSSVSWHNIRTFYHLVKRVHKQLGDNNPWSKNDIIAALMCNTEQGERSYIPNVFRPYGDVNQCYFLKVRVLSFLHDAVSDGEVSKGVTFERIISFALFYGYRRDWVIKTIEESVRERLIECIETPSDSDITLEYKVNSTHSFRISPLGVSLIVEICFTAVYISFISIDLPYHETKPYSEIESLFNLIYSKPERGHPDGLSRDSIENILNSNIPKVSSQYLLTEFEREKLTLLKLKNHTEINMTERRVAEIISKSSLIFDDCIKASDCKPSQQFTFEFDGQLDEPVTLDINCIIPDSFKDVDFSKREYEHLIFIAIVILTYTGIEASTGVEITRVINEHLVDDDNKKFSNNISRALRSKKFSNLSWLLIRGDLHHKFKKFSLNSGWQDCWCEYFYETAPDILK